MSLHRPRAAADLRTPDGAEFRAFKVARDDFWVRACSEGIAPEVRSKITRASSTYLVPEPPALYRIHGAGPSRWLPHVAQASSPRNAQKLQESPVRAWPEWRLFRRLHERIVVGHLALCHKLTDKYLADHERDQRAEDYEEAWQFARLRFADRAIELYDPDMINPRSGKPYKFSTYAGPWVRNALQAWRKARVAAQQATIALREGCREEVGLDRMAPIAASSVVFDLDEALDLMTLVGIDGD